MGAPNNPVTSLESGGLTEPPRLVRVDRYGSVSGLIEVEVTLGTLFVKYSEGVPYGS